MKPTHIKTLLVAMIALQAISLAQLTNTTTTAKACLQGSTYWGMITYYTNWTYTDAYGAHRFSGTSWQINGSPALCTGNLYGGFTADSTDGLGYHLATNGSSGTITLPEIHDGYVNPKYVIVGVTYAPPGPSSFVNYGSSTLVGNETSLSGSFATGTSVTVKVSAGIKGWVNGSVSASSSTSYTHTSNTASSVTISKQTAVADQTPGPSSPYVGINHDYDVIWLWLNPIGLFTTFTSSSGVNAVQWRGYGFSTLDQPVMDVYPVYVGWLNGDIAMTTAQKAPLNRTWAASQIWPTGQGPGLTSTDFQTIEKADPYWQCKKTPSACPTTVDPNRYTLTTNNADFVYQQAPAGGQPGTQTYSQTYTNTTTQSQGAKNEFSQVFGVEVSFGGTVFLTKFQKTLTFSQTLKWSHEWNRKMTSTNSSTSSLSITGPPCVTPGSPCNPNYTGSTQFDLYEDVLYGTFLFNPVN